MTAHIKPLLIECPCCGQEVARVFGADGKCGDCLTREIDAMRKHIFDILYGPKDGLSLHKQVFNILFGARDDRPPSMLFDDGRQDDPAYGGYER